MKYNRTFREALEQVREAPDHEISMARGELKATADKALELVAALEGKSDEGNPMEAWVQSKITKAKDYVNSVYDYLMYNPNMANEDFDDINRNRRLGNKTVPTKGTKGISAKDDKEKAEDEVQLLKNKIYTSLEYYYGNTHPFLCHHILFHPEYNWSINWDMKVDPELYLKMDRQTLAKALEASPKICRTVKCNKSVVLLNADYALKTQKYSEIGIEEINKRVKTLKDNPQFIELISEILSEKAQQKMSMDQTELLFEETIYAGGFANDKDKSVMRKFHEVDWKEKLNLIEKFSEERFQYFAECLIYEENPDILPKTIYNKINRSFAERLLSKNKEKWETIPSFYSEADTLRETKYKDDQDALDLIEQYNQYVMEIEARFESA